MASMARNSVLTVGGAFLGAHVEVAEAGDRGVSLAVREQAGMERGEHAHLRRGPTVDRLAPGHHEELLVGQAPGPEAPGRLGRGDHGGPGAEGDGVGAVEMVEVGMADEDEVGLVDPGRGEPDGVEAGEAVQVGVEEQVQAGVTQPEGRRPEPFQGRRGHGGSADGLVGHLGRVPDELGRELDRFDRARRPRLQGGPDDDQDHAEPEDVGPAQHEDAETPEHVGG